MTYQVAVQYTDTVDTLPASFDTYEDAMETVRKVQQTFSPGDALTVFVIAGERHPVIGH